MQEKLDNFEKKITHIQKYFLIVVLAFMAVSMFLSVFFRYVLNNPLSWTEEVLSTMQGALAFVGIGYCWHYKAHTRVLLLHDKLPIKVRYCIDFACNAIVIYCLFRILLTLPKYIKSKSAFLVSVKWLNYDVFNYFIVFGFCLAVLYVVIDEIRIINNIRNLKMTDTNRS